MTDKLTAKQARFVKEYLIDLNGQQAAIRAGYSENSAAVIASQNLNKLNVKAAIDAAKAKREQSLELDARLVLEELIALATSNHKNYEIDAYGQLNASEKDMKAVKKFRRKMLIDAEGNVNGVEADVELWDKPKALELLGRHLRLWDNDAPKGGDTINNFIKVEFVTPNSPDTGSVQGVISAKKI